MKHVVYAALQRAVSPKNTTPESKMWSETGLFEATKNSFKKQVCELAPWPTSFVLDPRYICIFLVRLTVVCLLCVLEVFIFWSRLSSSSFMMSVLGFCFRCLACLE